jgi:amino acid transporter
VLLAGGAIKRLFVGRPLRTTQLGDTLLPKTLALPIFCSDPISSVAYATEEILLVTGYGGAAYLSLSRPIAACVAVLLVVVVASYRQTCYAYPNGGGAFIVSQENIGQGAALVAAAALLVDYVMTVAVSVVAGVVAITSAAPSLSHLAVPFSVGFVVLIALVNLRGVKESGRLFAIPTYTFIVGVLLMLGFAVCYGVFGHGLPAAPSAHEQLSRSAQVGGFATVFLAMRAFASGCTALTGVEAISNGVPSFRKPKSRNAARTLVTMGGLAVTMFVGITLLAIETHARAYPSGSPSVISQLAQVVWGRHSPLYVIFQAATAAILILAANTAFSGFPMLASILAQNRYLPRQLHTRGDRLVFSNGILLLAGAAIGLIVAFDANIDRLIQLYIIGVFTSFTLSQSGMVRHWSKELGRADALQRRKIRRSQGINLFGAVLTGLVLVIVVVTKVEHGAWLAIAAMVLLFVAMRGIRRHYDNVSSELAVDEDVRPMLPARNHAIVLVSTMHLPTLRALAFARSLRPHTIEALTVNVDPAATERLQEAWVRRDLGVPLQVLDSPYREITQPVVNYVRAMHRASPRDVVTVFVPEYVVGRWWEQLLHNQSALRLKARLLFEPGVMVVSVPWQLRSAALSADELQEAGPVEDADPESATPTRS